MSGSDHRREELEEREARGVDVTLAKRCHLWNNVMTWVEGGVGGT